MKEIQEQQKQNENIILRFDEVLTEKASKMSVDAIFKLTKDNIDSKLSVTEYEQDKALNYYEIEECKAEVNRLSKIISDLNFAVETEIRSAVKKGIQQAKSEIKFKYNGSNILCEDEIKELDKYVFNLDHGRTDSFALARSSKSRNTRTITTNKDKVQLDLNVYDNNSYAPASSHKPNTGNKVDSLDRLRNFKLKGYASNLGRTKTLPEINQVDVRLSRSRFERQPDGSFI